MVLSPSSVWGQGSCWYGSFRTGEGKRPAHNTVCGVHVQCSAEWPVCWCVFVLRNICFVVWHFFIVV